MYSKLTKYYLLALLYIIPFWTIAQDHPRIYITDAQKNDFLNRIEESERVGEFIDELKVHLEPYVERHKTDGEWIVSRLQMYWISGEENMP